ncbi:MAG: molybdopterin-binding protein [Oscillospiraceae bacterium]|nr:molybdopterin-binding protein [Oscillospiraceae bacterium]
MKKIKVEDAIGMTLCHDITAIRDGFKGAAFKRGHVITEEDVENLKDIGKRHVFVWEENAGEIHEEDAAIRLSRLCAVEGGKYTGPSEGKMVQTAAVRGLFRVNVPLQRAINSIGDITISSIPDHYPVEVGQRLASMRIIPLVTQESQILEAERLCAESEEPLMQLLPYRALKVGIIITGSEIYTGRIPDKFEPVLRKKVAQYGGEVIGVTFCDDDLSMLDNALKTYADADLILMTGGMSVDPDDLTPTAIRNAGANIITYGMPSQPGNMLLVGYLGKSTVVGVPGAAAKLPTTTLDVVLPQIFAGIPFTKEDFIRLGDGGFCQSCDACHWPNCTFGRY